VAALENVAVWQDVVTNVVNATDTESLPGRRLIRGDAWQQPQTRSLGGLASLCATESSSARSGLCRSPDTDDQR
jgi:hypothetical protein